MIQANELRIGNYIMYVEGEVGKVVGINDHGYIAISCDREYFGQSDYDPIPITPEILEKCGFEKLQDDGSFWMEKQVTIGETTIIFCEGDRNGFCEVFICGMDDVRVESLHQLQSLYLSITGTELNVQL